MLPTMSEAANRRMDSPIPASPLAVVDHDHRIIRSGAREILTAVGEVIYEWSIGDDTIRWGGNALEVLKVASLDQIATGRAFSQGKVQGLKTARLPETGVDRNRRRSPSVRLQRRP